MKRKRPLKHLTVVRGKGSANPFDRDEEPSVARLPEYNLLSAVLYRALLDLLSDESHIARSSYVWFTKRPKAGSKDQGISFSFICEHLDLEEHSMRMRAKDLYALIRREKVMDLESTTSLLNELKVFSRKSGKSI